MTRPPSLEQRPAQPYLAIAKPVTPQTFRSAVDTGFPQLFGWLAERGIEPGGPPLIRFLAIDPEGEPLEIELGAPVAEAVAGDGAIRAGELPAGRYATLLHVGPYRHETVPDLAVARATLLAWAKDNGVVLDGVESERGTELGCCVDRYLTDPSSEPDWSKWETELAYLTAGG